MVRIIAVIVDTQNITKYNSKAETVLLGGHVMSRKRGLWPLRSSLSVCTQEMASDATILFLLFLVEMIDAIVGMACNNKS